MRDNNINFLRLFFALLVLISHSFAICYSNEPIVGRGYGIGSIGTLGVFGFFTISGYLITKSFQRNSNIIIFSWHRLLRIYPALIFAVIGSALLMFFMQDNVGFIKYISLESFKNYILGNATLINIGSNAIEYSLWGTNKYNVINGPLWTLPVELRMYLFTGLLGLLGLLYKKASFNMIIIVFLFLDYTNFYNFILLNIQEPSKLQALNPILYFIAGIFFAVNKMPFYKSLFILSVIGAVISVYKVIPLALQVFFISYVFYFVAFKGNILKRFFNNIGDYSYGIYILFLYNKVYIIFQNNILEFQ